MRIDNNIYRAVEMRYDNTMRQAAGFTLIELMIVVAIIVVIASIALPSYQEHVRKARRTAGAACASAVAQRLERYYTANLTYTGAPAVATLTAACDPDALRFYAIDTIDLGQKTYTVTATPANDHTDPTCGVLSVNQAGVKSPSTAGCW